MKLALGVCILALPVLVLSAFRAPAPGPADEPRAVPAFTAYFRPDPDHGPRRDEDGRLHGWTPATRLEWFGRLQAPGKLSIALEIAGAAPGDVALRMRVRSQVDASLVGTLDVKVSNGAHELALPIGTATIAVAGYYRFTLECPDTSARALPDLRALVLSGPAAAGAHFSSVERRNAASVHLGYPVPKEVREEIEWFYVEIEPQTEPLYTYYEATGFDRGYFGIQVNSPTERRIIFSVWDAGNEAVDRSKVAEADRVKLLAQGQDVVASDFGNEGTGGHSHLVRPWKLGERFRFLLRAEPGAGELAGTTTYTAWFWFAEDKRWGLVASFRAPRAGRFLHGLYSFNENFGGSNGDERRVCRFGNGWVRTHAGEWLALNEARFTHDGHGKEQRLDRSAGVLDGRFYLANGGFVDDTTPGAVLRAGDVLKLEKAAGEHPLDKELPAP